MEELDTKKVYTVIKDYPLSIIKEMFDDGDIIPQPDYQRDYIMDDKKASKLIESVILQIPIPTVYLCEESDGTLSIIDGQQRLTSFVKFLKNEFSLKNLEEYSDFNGKKFADLDKTIQRAIKNTSIHSIVIKKESQKLKYEIFARLNQGATSLKPQELRNCIYRGSFNNMLEEISKSNKTLAFLMGTENNRKSYQEIILRYFALKNYQEYSSSIAKTLNLYMEKHQNDSKEDIEQLKKEFNSNIDIIKQVLGNDAFMGYDRAKGKMTNKFSGSIYDSIIIGFSRFNNHDIMAHSDEIRQEIKEMKMNDPEYQDYTYAATGSKGRVIGRIMKVYDLLSKIIGKKGDYGVKRIYPKETKEELWHEGYICSYCGNRILNIDDAEVDHIEAFVSGGETDKENVQLLHRHCNREKYANDVEFENEEVVEN